MTRSRYRRPTRLLIRTTICALTLAAPALIAPALIAPARAWVTLAPYKDKLFSYGGILERNDDGSFIVVDYQEARDVNRRDSVPVLRVRRAYVDLSVRSQESRETIEADGHHIPVDVTGDPANAKFAVIFIHGRGGDRRLGSNDWTFGGNFNRIKNLAVRNGGVYIAPTVRSFGDDGAADVAALIDDVARRSPKAKIVLSCASMGSFICWHLADRKSTVRHLAGMIVMGGIDDPPYLASPAFKARLPLLMTHGSDDPVYSWQKQKQIFDRIRKATPHYPVRFVLFRTGIHGTPVRMTDWRSALNWIFAEAASR